MAKSTPVLELLISVTSTDRCVVVAWADGAESEFHHIWLRDNCRCDACGDPAVGRRKLRLTDLPLDVAPADVRLDGQKGLMIRWCDNHETRFSGAWLRSHAYDDLSRRARRFEPTLWTAQTRRTPPTMDFETVMADETAFLELLYTVRDLGLCFLFDAPAEAGTAERLALKIGYPQESNFGRIQDLVVDHGKRSVANRTIGLKPHTDEPYRASPPGLLLFHCVETDVTGAGSSTFIDGFEIAAVLRAEDPEGFAVLARNPHSFRRHFSNDIDLISEFPVISIDGFDNVDGIRINDRVAAPLSIPPERVPVYYRGLRRLLELAEDPERIIELTLRPGHMAVFDNHRVLHGRTALTLKGRRWLQWMQVERGDFYSTLRITADRLQVARGATPWLRGAYGSTTIS